MGLKRAFVIGLCLAAVAAVVMLAAVIIRPTENIYKRDMPLQTAKHLKKTAMQDKNGEPSDWIEIYNPTNKDISLTGFHFQKMAVEISLWADMSLKPMTI